MATPLAIVLALTILSARPSLTTAIRCATSQDCWEGSNGLRSFCLRSSSLCINIPLPAADHTVRQFQPGDQLELTTKESIINETNSVPISLEDRQDILFKAAAVMRNLSPHRFLHLNLLEIDPAQEMEDFAMRLPTLNLTNVEYHEEVRNIFQRMNDFHTLYIRPKPLRSAIALLGFTLREFYDPGIDQRSVPKYVVSDIVPDFFSSQSFVAGVEILEWSGVPIEDAVRVEGERSFGANPAAQMATGLRQLATRLLAIQPIPEEENVEIKFKSLTGELEVFSTPWIFVIDKSGGLFGLGRQLLGSSTNEKGKLALHEYVKPVPQLGRMPQMRLRVKENRNTIEVNDILSESLEAEILQTSVGAVGRILIRNFPSFSSEIIQEYARILKLMPENGLVIDIRGSLGGDPDLVKAILEQISDIEVPPLITTIRSTPFTANFILGENSVVSPFIERFVTPYQAAMRTAIAVGEQFTGPVAEGLITNLVKERQARVYFGPIIAVSDAITYSSGDIFSAFLVDTGIAELVGVANATGGGGASTTRYSVLSENFPKATVPLPNVGADFTTSYARFYRSGNNSGAIVENFGITPNVLYYPTYNDVVNRDSDLFEFLAARVTSATGLESSPESVIASMEPTM